MDKLLELVLYGDGIGWILSNNIKLLTIRLDTPKYTEHQPGRNLIIKYDGDRKLGVVFSRQVKPLKHFTPAELMLDGYLSAIEAAKDLRRYPGYEKVSINTPVLGLGFTTSSHFGAYLSGQRQKQLLGLDLYQAILDPEFHNFFLPSYLWWLHIKNDEAGSKISVAKWHDLLVNHLGLFSREDLKHVRMVDSQTQKFYSGLREKSIMDILKYSPSNGSQYQSLVLCKPVSVK